MPIATPNFQRALAALVFVASVVSTTGWAVAAPTSVSTKVAPPRPGTDFTPIAARFLGIPFVEDGVQDGAGRWTTFAHPETIQDRYGLNCSGLTTTIFRALSGLNVDLVDVQDDRLKDSGPASPLGQDWDFGWDLVMNLGDFFQCRILDGAGPDPDLKGKDGRTLRGFRIEDRNAWATVLPGFRTDRIYLASFSKDLPSGFVRHYHTAVLLKDAAGKVWLYQTAPGRVSRRVDITGKTGRDNLTKLFGRGKRILLLEVDPTGRPQV
jgi:hypothetical protein